MAAPTDNGELRYSTPPTIKGVALKLPVDGDAPSRHRFGSMRLSSSKMTLGAAVHSLPPGIVRLSDPSGVLARQAILSCEKLSFVIWSSGEYFVLPRSPPYVRHSPRAVVGGSTP